MTPRSLGAFARGSALAAGWLGGAAALGAAFAYGAFLGGPLLLPGAIAAVALAIASFSRPHIGIAAGLVLVAVGPIGVLPGPPWLPGASWSAFLFLVALVKSLLGDERRPLPQLAPVALLFAVAAVAGLAGAVDPSASVPLVRSLVTGLMLFFAIATMVTSRHQVMWVLGGAVAGGVLVASDALLQYRAGAPTDVGFFTTSGELVYRITGGFSSPNQLAGFLVVLAPFALAGALGVPRGRVLFAAALALIAAGVYVSYSRGALIALAVIPFVFLRGRQVLLGAPLIAVLAYLLAPGLLVERFATLTAEGSELATRMEIWRTAASIWQEHPVIGVGLGGFPDAYAQARVPGKMFLPTTIFTPPPHAHNLVLQQLAETGLLGLVALSAVFAAGVHTALALRRRAERWIRLMGTGFLAFLAAFLVHNAFDVTLLENTGIYFWALLGLLSAVAAVARDEAGDRDGTEAAG